MDLIISRHKAEMNIGTKEVGLYWAMTTIESDYCRAYGTVKDY